MYPKSYQIAQDSVFKSAAVTPVTQAMPFRIIRAGYFKATEKYHIQNQDSSSFLLIYTVKKCGFLETAEVKIRLPEKHAVLFDCMLPHTYYSDREGWDFYWISLDRNNTEQLFRILCPEKPFAVDMHKNNSLEKLLEELIRNIELNDIQNCITRSSKIHELLNHLMNMALDNESEAQKKNYRAEIDAAVAFIHSNYKKQITLDDILADVHISKYHFIRIFHRIMGTTPYSYLTSYRISMAKTMLCSTQHSIAEIAGLCGFLDTSQFIRHFKKYTGMRPRQYRAEFEI